MSYMHIDNLYKAQEILLFRRCYAMEKIHGTSAHLHWSGSTLSFFAGGGQPLKPYLLFFAACLCLILSVKLVNYGFWNINFGPQDWRSEFAILAAWFPFFVGVVLVLWAFGMIPF